MKLSPTARLSLQGFAGLICLVAGIYLLAGRGWALVVVGVVLLIAPALDTVARLRA